MRRVLRRLRDLPLTLGIACLLVVGAWQCVQTRESVEIRNETPYEVLVQKSDLSFPCSGSEISPHSTGSFSHTWACGFSVTWLYFYHDGTTIGYCSWSSANEHEPVIVKEDSVSCEN